MLFLSINPGYASDEYKDVKRHARPWLAGLEPAGCCCHVGVPKAAPRALQHSAAWQRGGVEVSRQCYEDRDTMKIRNMKIATEDFRVRKDDKVDLDKWPTIIDPVYKSKEHYRELLADHVEKLSDQQQRLYASNRHAVLLIFQAMDAAGKDGVIRHVMSGVNPQGCQVFSFKHPSAVELQHDFLWRTTRDLPERGRIGIFNRSYYEEVLIARVHPEILSSEGLPDQAADKKTIWHSRYRSIVDLERHLHDNGTRIVKFFLHLSKEEQRKRFLARIDEPEKNWKFSMADIEERGYWKDYMKAYGKCLGATSTSDAPWYVVPADDKENARLIVLQTVLDTFRKLKMRYPETTEARRGELLAIRGQLTK
jgi:PPK2 family polyphosphate:nucleotide phosphotransferase